MRVLPAGVLLLLAAGTVSVLFGQAPSVPFVGCASSGQIDTLQAPKGTSRSVWISPKGTQALAYYKSADGICILAPRGWYCEGVSDSSGYALYVGPKAIRHSLSGWEGLEGTAIEVNHITSGASGRYQIVELIARLFPAYKPWAVSVLGEMDIPLPSGPYLKDTLSYRGKTIVEYKPPAQTEGLGNFDSWLGKTDTPIVGAAIVIGHHSLRRTRLGWRHSPSTRLLTILPPSANFLA
jgi:hypothetical protein